jgi:hypothetical protein
MRKLIHSDAQPELLNKVASQISLIETDKNIKSASNDPITRELLSDLKPDKDHFMCHLIALGDHETYGPNRNGDSFPKEACQKYIDTFVKNGYFYREHKNRGKKDSIGTIKAAHYNEDMGRVELVIWGDKKLAEPEWDLIKSGNALSFSMSCSVPNDRSNLDGTLHKTTAEYDDNLKYKMNQYIPEFKKYAFVYNDEPNWFDISKVAKPADRIAHYLVYDQGDVENESLQKCASHGRVISSAELAEREGVIIPDGSSLSYGCVSSTKQATLEKLAALEEKLQQYLASPEQFGQGEFAQYVKHAAVNSVDPEDQYTNEEIDKLRDLQPTTLFYELAKKAQVLPFKSFVAFSTGQKIEDIEKSASYKYACSCCMPSMFQDMLGAPLSDLENIPRDHGQS